MNFSKDFSFGSVLFINFLNITLKEKELIRQWRNNIKIRKWMLNDKIISKKEHMVFLRDLKDDKKNIYWLVKEEKEGRYLGVVYLNKLDYENKNAHLGIYVSPSYMNQGFGTLILTCLKKLFFNMAVWHTLKVEVLDDNKLAIKLYKKTGFIEEGRLKEVIFRNKKLHDLIIMGIYLKKN